jgi:hypothetical protein
LTYNPFGIWEKYPISSYKHIFPSGIFIETILLKKNWNIEFIQIKTGYIIPLSIY